MNIISKREFDERVGELYTPNSDDSQLQINKYSYEAYIDSIEDLILESIENPTTISDIDEPVYVSLIGPDGLESIDLVRDLNSKGLIHGLLLLNVSAHRAMMYIQDGLLGDIWLIRELHILSHDIYIQHIDSTLRPNLDRDLIKHVGLHGHSGILWEHLGLYHIPIQELSMRALGIDDRMRSLTEPIYLQQSIRVIDIELSDDLLRYDHVLYVRHLDILTNIQYYSVMRLQWHLNDIMQLLDNPNLNTLKIMGNIPKINVSRTKRYSLLELDMTYRNRSRYMIPLTHFPHLESLKINYTQSNSTLVNVGPWSRLPDLKILHLFGGIGMYRDNFDHLKNVRELKITISMSPSLAFNIPSSIYNMNSLDTLILSGISLESINYIDMNRFRSRPNIVLENILLHYSDELLEYIAENEQNLSDEIILALSEALREYVN